MQFKKGAAERRVPEFKRHESEMEAQQNQQAAEENRANYPYARQGGEAGAEAEAAEPKRPARASQVESLIDAGAVVDGHFQADNDLRIQGTISGEVTCRGILTIEQHAVTKARINTQECEVYGTVDGDITCSGRLRLASTAVVNATMRAGSLMVEEGASINGSVETNYSGEVTSAATGSSRRRGRKDDATEDEDANGNAPRAGRRDAPSFALVSSEESASRRENRSS